MAFDTAAENKVPYLYHWERLDLGKVEQTLATNSIYCPNPSQFNDPWDGKPHFNTAILDDPEENERHVQWAVGLFRKQQPPLPEQEIARREAILRTDRPFAAGVIEQFSGAMAQAIAAQYRVYCLGTDATNQLMWAHYADSHRGVCLEFVVRDFVMCGALKCEYLEDYPVIKHYEDETTQILRMVRIKAKVWEYEDEYRLIAFERPAVPTQDTLVTENNLLQLGRETLSAVIVGC